jgi:eukaryotic-like serine/threonine-protein kinase
MSASPQAAPEDCPDENALAGFASGTLSGPNASRVEAHLDGCADCRALVAAVAAERSTPEAASAETRLDTGAPTLLGTGASAQPRELEGPALRPGEVLGRYVISGGLGAGGMGVVYAAEDPRLGRRVALKLLRSARADAAGERQARLEREAQAMARLSHPNVLPVFDMGVEGGQVFLAMELVEGSNLAEWLRQRERPWREVLGLFLEAGRGLAAAHRAGLVHRDFKPANVLVGTDGRPRVTDFGLVRVDAAWEEAGAALAAGDSERTLTRAGSVPGTPAYMSPEQLAGHPVDARGDQFSFCVALYEALNGVRPFAADAPAESRWRLRRSERSPRLPGRVRAALARGLALEPAERFASMEALLDALATAPASHGRWWAVGLAVGLTLAGAAGWAWWGREDDPVSSEEKKTLVTLGAGEHQSLDVPRLARVAVGDPSIADVKVENGIVHLWGMKPGATTVLVWEADGTRHAFFVTVQEPGGTPGAPTD